MWLLVLATFGGISAANAQSQANTTSTPYQSVVVPQPQVFVENRAAEVFNWTPVLRVSIDTQFSLEERKIIAQRLEEAVRIYQFSKFFDSDIDRITKGGYEHGFMSYKQNLQPICELDQVQGHRKKVSKKRKASQFPEIRLERKSVSPNPAEGYRLDLA
ncbi:MAG: hypothetical protein ACK45C_06165, partial [Bacteroidota bacterium]